MRNVTIILIQSTLSLHVADALVPSIESILNSILLS